jgi:hypothetical protein
MDTPTISRCSPVIFSHEILPEFIKVATPHEWTLAAVVVSEIYKVDSSAYSDPMHDLCEQLRERAQEFTPRGYALRYYFITYDKPTPKMAIKIIHPDGSGIHAITVVAKTLLR